MKKHNISLAVVLDSVFNVIILLLFYHYKLSVEYENKHSDDYMVDIDRCMHYTETLIVVITLLVLITIAVFVFSYAKDINNKEFKSKSYFLKNFTIAAIPYLISIIYLVLFYLSLAYGFDGIA